MKNFLSTRSSLEGNRSMKGRGRQFNEESTVIINNEMSEKLQRIVVSDDEASKGEYAH